MPGAPAPMISSPDGTWVATLDENGTGQITNLSINGTDNTSCAADVDGNGTVEMVDVLAILRAWGPCPGCPEDLDDDGVVDLADLLFALGRWGPC